MIVFEILNLGVIKLSKRDFNLAKNEAISNSRYLNIKSIYLLYNFS